MSELVHVAYLRAYDSKNCDLRITIDLEIAEGDKVTKEIRGFAEVTDPVSVLVKDVKDNILEFQRNNKENINSSGNSHEEEEVSDPQVIFMRDSEPYRVNIILDHLIKDIQNGLQLYVQILQNKYKVVLNAPLVRELKLPVVIYAKYSVEPLKFHTVFVNKEMSKFFWYKSVDKKKWDRVGQEFKYKVEESDVGHYLKLTCVLYNKNMTKGPLAEVISGNKVEIINDFPKCPFEDRHCLTRQRLDGKNFRVVSYNILADRYVNKVDYSYCPQKALGIHYRKQLVIKELKGYQADIICLQEVDDAHFREYYKKELKTMGYNSFYHRKGNCIPEGLTCAFKNNRYRLLESKHIVLKSELERRKQFADVVHHLNLNEEVKNTFLKQFTSLQVTVLEDRKVKKVLIVANTHLYYHPDAPHIRLLQAFMALIFLNNIKNRLAQEHKNVAVVFCGDFNSSPSSSLYNLMTTGTIDSRHEDCLKISQTGDSQIYHRFFFECASGTPKYTNYAPDFKDCLDYIFIESNKITVKQIVPVISEEILQKYEGLPNEYFPSDHLAIVVDLQLKER